MCGTIVSSSEASSAARSGLRLQMMTLPTPRPAILVATSRFISPAATTSKVLLLGF